MHILLLIANFLCMTLILKNTKRFKVTKGNNILLGFGIVCTIGSVVLLEVKEASLGYSILAIIIYIIYLFKSDIFSKPIVKNPITISKNLEFRHTSPTNKIKVINSNNLSDKQLNYYLRKGDEQINRINKIKGDTEAIEVYENIIFEEGMYFRGDTHIMRLAELYYKTEQYDKAWNYLNELQFVYPHLMQKIRYLQVKILKKEDKNTDALATLMCAHLYGCNAEKFKIEAKILLKKLGLDSDKNYADYLVYLINSQLKNTTLSNSVKEVNLRRALKNFLTEIASSQDLSSKLTKAKKDMETKNKIEKPKLNIKSGYYPEKLQAILNEQPPNTRNLNELDKFYQNRAKKLQEIHLANISNFVREPNKYNTSPITSVEKSFSKYIDSQPIETPSIAQYWTYEYNIDYNKTINRLLDSGYLEISNYQNPEAMKVDELKTLLNKFGIKATGNKHTLIQLVHKNISKEMLDNLPKDTPKYFRVTNNNVTNNIKSSITKDLDFEDECYALIYNYEFEKANTLIYQFEDKKNIKQCINISSGKYENPINPKLDERTLKAFEVYIDSTDATIPMSLQKYEKEMRVCIIMGKIMGAGLNKIELLFLRKNDIDIDKKLLSNTIHKLYFDL